MNKTTLHSIVRSWDVERLNGERFERLDQVFAYNPEQADVQEQRIKLLTDIFGVFLCIFPRCFPVVATVSKEATLMGNVDVLVLGVCK